MAAAEKSPTVPVRAVRPPREPGTIVLVISGSIAQADVPGLCQHARELLEKSAAELVVCDVGALVDPDVAVVEALARLQLTARRVGRGIRLRHAGGELEELLALTGLTAAVPLCAELPLEPSGQAEEGEEPRGVEEEADPGDPLG